MIHRAVWMRWKTDQPVWLWTLLVYLVRDKNAYHEWRDYGGEA